MKKWLMFMLVLVLLCTPLLANEVHAGILGKGDATGTPGEWYIGDQPATVKPGSLPIVFVHGLNSSSNIWIDQNDMDEITYNENYQTAFINLYPTKNMWDNGQLLASKLSEMYTYFGKKMILVTHSKGGVDAQAALVHSNAGKYVEKVITLSTPHHGSQLADLAYSNWAGWLAAIIGNRNDATYSLQTGYMSYFRSITDSNPNSLLKPYYTFGGTSWGNFGGSLYWGGLYLRQYGSNDGAVTVTSSRLPYGNEVRIGKWDHFTIKNGSTTFNLFQPYLTKNVAAFTSLQPSIIAEDDQEANVVVRGGKFTGKKVETFEVEENTKSIAFDWMSQNSDSVITLEGPNHQTYTNMTKTYDTGMFQGAIHHQMSVTSPAAGTWKVKVKQPKKESYLMQVVYESELNADLTIEASSKKEVKLQVNPTKVDRKSISGDIVIQYSKNGKTKQKKISQKKFNSLESFPIKDAGEGVYHIMLDVKGDTKKGEQFERTILYTIYVDQNGKMYKP
ncbi:esterase/lipase family protein [Guptibacillus hwajinpoensis]|uniref:esterase/lipase family protein n=1 Tax=Guptibacillus hwajinpoensis TaxID=208199 RepID=UPI003734E610